MRDWNLFEFCALIPKAFGIVLWNNVMHFIGVCTKLSGFSKYRIKKIHTFDSFNILVFQFKNFECMETFRVIIKNNLQMISPVQASVHAYASHIGFPEKQCLSLELVIEELLSNVIKFDFIPGQVEDIEITLTKTTLGLNIIITSKSIPLDIDKIKSFENINSFDIIENNATGLGTLLVKNFVDSVNYINNGREGQEIIIEKYLSQEHTYGDKDNTATRQKPTKKKHFKFYIRRLKPEEAPIVSKLAYYSYQSTYFYDQIYYPERVRQLNNTNEMMSFVAVNYDNEEILGHCANVKDHHSGMLEMAVGFVNPVSRGSGCLNQLLLYLITDCINKKQDGVFGQAITTHPYSQKSLLKIGLHESALLISYMNPVSMNKIKNNLGRESLLLMYKPLNNEYHKTVFAPAHHRKMIEEIYDNTGVLPNFIPFEDDAISEELTSLQLKTGSYLSSHIYINTYGQDSIYKVNKTLRTLCVDRIETIFLYLPLKESATAKLCQAFEDMGFFFSGIRPGFDENDWLILQYLNNQVYQYENLQFASDFGRHLLRYIESHDPNNSD